MSTSVRVFFVNRAGEHLNRAHEELAVLRGGALQIFDEVFQFLRHEVEGLGKFANLGAALQLHAL